MRRMVIFLAKDVNYDYPARGAQNSSKPLLNIAFRGLSLKFVGIKTLSISARMSPERP